MSVNIVAKRLDGSIKMPLGTEVGLVPCDIVLDGDTSPTGAQHPTPFGPCLIVATIDIGRKEGAAVPHLEEAGS